MLWLKVVCSGVKLTKGFKGPRLMLELEADLMIVYVMLVLEAFRMKESRST